MKKFLSSILAFLVVSLSLPNQIRAWADSTISGVAGSKATWALEADGVLRVHGEGLIGCDDLTNGLKSYSNAIKSIVIEDGITDIGTRCFCEYPNLKSVIIAASVTSIGDGAFGECNNLRDVSYYGYSKFEPGTSDPTFPDELDYVNVQCDYPYNYICAIAVSRSLHTMTAWTTTSEPACTVDGCRTRECERADCTHVETEPIPAIGHNYGEWQTTEPTCTIDGSKTRQCTREGCEHIESVIIPAIGHDYGEWQTTAPTCTVNGLKTRECNRCHDIESVMIPAIGHDYGTQIVPATENTLGGTRHRCYNCGDEFWTDFTKDDTYAQVNMPNGETVYHYCTHNGLATETTVDLGDGTTLRVFLQDPLRVLKKNDSDVIGAVVTFVPEGSARYNELIQHKDADHEHEHLKLFEVYPTVNGRPVTGALDGSVYMEYEIPEGWDESDLEMILVRDGEDQEFDETVLEIDGKRYLAMWKNHFSPYAMIDKLSDEEKALLNSLPDDKKQELLEAVEQLEKAVEAESNESAEKNEEKSSSNNVKTGDESGYVALLALSTLITTGLYLELFMKKKRNV